MAKKAEELIYRVYDLNNCAELDYTTEVDSAILGDGCYKVTWDAIAKRVRITTPDVNGIFAWWQGDDITRVYRVASRYQLTSDEVAALYGRKISKKNAMITELWDAREFALYLDDSAIDRKPNPYGFIPFIIFPNLRQPKEFWGVSDIPALREPQRELNRALTQLSRILEVSGNPIAVLEGVEQSENIQVQPGAVWNVPPDTRAYLLDLLQGGGIRLHIDYIDMVYRCLHDISESPRAAYGGMQRELSGIALEVELQSLLQKVRRKRLIRTNAYRRRNDMIRPCIRSLPARTSPGSPSAYSGARSFPRTVPGKRRTSSFWSSRASTPGAPPWITSPSATPKPSSLNGCRKENKSSK